MAPWARERHPLRRVLPLPESITCWRRRAGKRQRAELYANHHTGLPCAGREVRTPDHAHSVNSSAAYNAFQDGRALMRAASAASDGHVVAGFGMLRDHRISIVA